jgi:type IV secretion system protein VirB10
MSVAEAPSDDIRPLVGRDTGNRPLWIGIGAIGIAAMLLFAILESRREALTAPAIKPRAADLSSIPSTVPPLYVPPELATDPQPTPMLALPPRLSAAFDRPLPIPRASEPAPAQRPLPPEYAYAPPLTAPAQERPRNGPPGSAVVFDGGTPVSTLTGATPPTGEGSAPAAAIATRASASRIANRATIIPQGTLIDAVLESAIDSTQPGQVRALVSRDVTSVIGKRVLIPRGSRLFGSYKGELASGQRRAQVQWSRLVRPDGVAIALDSPAADRLGRAGIGGRVNTYFLERLGGALLQSSIDIGTAVASRSISSDTVIVALPGSVQNATSGIAGQPPKPTLSVRQGTRISVFVARDLDFTGVEPRR